MVPPAEGLLRVVEDFDEDVVRRDDELVGNDGRKSLLVRHEPGEVPPPAGSQHLLSLVPSLSGLPRDACTGKDFSEFSLHEAPLCGSSYHARERERVNGEFLNWGKSWYGGVRE